MIKYITSKNQTHHFGLYNHRNSYCHYIGVLQRLHSCPTLNSILLSESSEFGISKLYQNSNSNFVIDTNYETLANNFNLPINEVKYISNVMYPVFLYATFERSLTNDTEIFDSIRQYFPNFESEFISANSRDGYFPETVLTTIFLPIVYKLFPSKFELILRELAIDVINFENICCEVNSIISNESRLFFSNGFDQIQLSYYNNMMSKLPSKIEKNSFCAAVLEVFPEKESGGHAVSLISCIEPEETFYIIDDQHTISTLNDYINRRLERLYSITLRDVDEITVANLNAFIQGRVETNSNTKTTTLYIEKRVNRYEMKPKQKGFSFTGGYRKESLIGGFGPESETKENLNGISKLILLLTSFEFIVGMLTGLIISTIVAIISLKVVRGYIWL